MATQTDIANRALSKLGAKRIASFSEQSANARAISDSYDIIRDAELRRHPWKFAIKRASIAADSESPSFGKTNSFTLPSDWLRMAPRYPEDNANDLDWEIEGKKIYTNDDAPLEIRYIARITDVSEYDALFIDALAARIALELCEQITQSNTKLAGVAGMYKEAIAEARKANAFDSLPQVPWDDEWITVRM